MQDYLSKKWKQAQNWVSTASLQAIRSSLLKREAKKHRYKILCVDFDRSFCKFLKRLARSLDIQLDSVNSMEAAKLAIKKNPDYKAYIIEGHLPDSSGFDLIAWIREKNEFLIPIGFVSRIYRDAKSFQFLKEKLKVAFVLDKPIRAGEAHQLLILLCHLEQEPSCQLPLRDSAIDLKKSFQKTLFDIIERLESLILKVDKNPTAENLQKLKHEVQQIAGSAETHGFQTASQLCKNFEWELSEQIDLAKEGRMTDKGLLALDEFFSQIKFDFQIEMS